VLARFNPGNVVLFYPPYRIDLSLNFFIFAAGAVRCHVRGHPRLAPDRSCPAAWRLPCQAREREQQGLARSLESLFEGRFGHAEKAATRASELPENAGVAALIGARAAHRMRQGAAATAGWPAPRSIPT
jgi:HemY protein